MPCGEGFSFRVLRCSRSYKLSRTSCTVCDNTQNSFPSGSASTAQVESCLADVDRSRAELYEAPDLIALGSSVGAEVQMDTVLRLLRVRYLSDLNSRPGFLGRAEAGTCLIGVQDFPSKCGAPEGGQHDEDRPRPWQ